MSRCHDHIKNHPDGELYGSLQEKIIVIFFTIFASLNLLSQTYILNEDFSSASGTTPPTGWVNSTVDGEAEDLWHFDNPGSKVVNYPMIGTFAIFDSEGISRNQVPENVILETPFLRCHH